MARTFPLMIAVLVLVPLAAAQPVEAPASPDAAAQTLDAVVSTARDAGASAASAASAAASATGDALAAAATFVGRVLVAGASAIGAAIVAVASSFALFGGAAAGFMGAHPKETAIVAGSTAGSAGLFVLLKRFGALLPLYTRLRPSQMLDNKARNAVYEHVRANPGAHPSGLAETLGLGWGTVVYHLNRLEESKLVVAKAAHHRKCYFAVGGDLDPAARTAVAAMAHDKARRIVEVVHAQPGITQKALAERVGMSQALASWHVKRLVESGVLLTSRDGRSNSLRVAAHVPVTAPAVAAVA